MSDLSAEHNSKLARAFEEIEEILGTADLSETVEMVRTLKQERDVAVVRAKYLEKADARMAQAEAEIRTRESQLADAKVMLANLSGERDFWQRRCAGTEQAAKRWKAEVEQMRASVEHLEVYERALRIITGLEEYQGRTLDTVESLQVVARAALAGAKQEKESETERLRLFVRQLADQRCQHEWDGRRPDWCCLDESKVEPKWTTIWKPCLPCQARAVLAGPEKPGHAVSSLATCAVCGVDLNPDEHEPGHEYGLCTECHLETAP